MAETMLERKDMMLNFGNVTSTGCDNIVNLNNTSAEGMDVVFTFPAAVSSAASLTVEGCDTESGSYTVIAVSPSKTYTAGETVRVGIPRGTKAKFLKVKGAASTACIDTYIGK